MPTRTPTKNLMKTPMSTPTSHLPRTTRGVLRGIIVGACLVATACAGSTAARKTHPAPTPARGTDAAAYDSAERGAATTEPTASATVASSAASTATTSSAPTGADAVPAASPAGAPVEWIEIAPRVRVDRASRTVEFEALVVLDTGFLEQFVCTEGTREHESLFVFEGAASSVHAALLLAGFTAGSPGRWVERQDAGELRFEGVAPTGSELRIEVRLPDGTTRPIDWFIRPAPIGDGAERTAAGAQSATRWQFVFGGSRFRTDRRTGNERYIADGSGSLVGLVTFGDETIGPREVLPDQASVSSPMWEVWTERMPPLGTRVTVVVRSGA